MRWLRDKSPRDRALWEALIWLTCIFAGAFFLVLGLTIRESGPWYELHQVAFVALFATAFVSPIVLIRLLAKLRKSR